MDVLSFQKYDDGKYAVIDAELEENIQHIAKHSGILSDDKYYEIYLTLKPLRRHFTGCEEDRLGKDGKTTKLEKILHTLNKQKTFPNLSKEDQEKALGRKLVLEELGEVRRDDIHYIRPLYLYWLYLEKKDLAEELITKAGLINSKTDNSANQIQIFEAILDRFKRTLDITKWGRSIKLFFGFVVLALAILLINSFYVGLNQGNIQKCLNLQEVMMQFSNSLPEGELTELLNKTCENDYNKINTAIYIKSQLDHVTVIDSLDRTIDEMKSVGGYNDKALAALYYEKGFNQLFVNSYAAMESMVHAKTLDPTLVSAGLFLAQVGYQYKGGRDKYKKLIKEAENYSAKSNNVIDKVYFELSTHFNREKETPSEQDGIKIIEKAYNRLRTDNSPLATNLRIILAEISISAYENISIAKRYLLKTNDCNSIKHTSNRGQCFMLLYQVAQEQEDEEKIFIAYNQAIDSFVQSSAYELIAKIKIFHNKNLNNYYTKQFTTSKADLSLREQEVFYLEAIHYAQKSENPKLLADIKYEYSKQILLRLKKDENEVYKANLEVIDLYEQYADKETYLGAIYENIQYESKFGSTKRAAKQYRDWLYNQVVSKPALNSYNRFLGISEKMHQASQHMTLAYYEKLSGNKNAHDDEYQKAVNLYKEEIDRKSSFQDLLRVSQLMSSAHNNLHMAEYALNLANDRYFNTLSPLEKFELYEAGLDLHVKADEHFLLGLLSPDITKEFIYNEAKRVVIKIRSLIKEEELEEEAGLNLASIEKKLELLNPKQKRLSHSEKRQQFFNELDVVCKIHNCQDKTSFLKKAFSVSELVNSGKLLSIGKFNQLLNNGRLLSSKNRDENFNPIDKLEKAAEVFAISLLYQSALTVELGNDKKKYLYSYQSYQEEYDVLVALFLIRKISYDPESSYPSPIRNAFDLAVISYALRYWELFDKFSEESYLILLGKIGVANDFWKEEFAIEIPLLRMKSFIVHCNETEAFNIIGKLIKRFPAIEEKLSLRKLVFNSISQIREEGACIP